MKVGERFVTENIEVFCEELNGSSIDGCSDLAEVLAVTSGEGEIVVEGERLKLSEGAVFVTRPHTYRKITSNGRMVVCRVGFSKEKLAFDLSQLVPRIDIEDGQGKIYFAGERFSLVRSAIDRFPSAALLPASHRKSYSTALLIELFAVISSLSGESVSRSLGELGAKVASYLNENLSSDLSLEHLSRAFFVSKFYLCRAFKKYSGTSIHSYVTAKRISLAKELIDSGETASAAAYKVGFGDYSAFYRAYTKHIGCAPTGK